MLTNGVKRVRTARIYADIVIVLIPLAALNIFFGIFAAIALSAPEISMMIIAILLFIDILTGTALYNFAKIMKS